MTSLIFLFGLSAKPADSCAYVPKPPILYFNSEEAFKEASKRRELASLLLESIKEEAQANQIDAKREKQIQHLLKALTRKEKSHAGNAAPVTGTR